MADTKKGISNRFLKGFKQITSKGSAIPITYKLVASFLLISISSNIIFTIAGISFIGNRIISEAQERVRTDLNSAREIYLGDLRHISDVVRITSRRPILQDFLNSGLTDTIQSDLINTRNNEGLDILTVTDKYGNVVLRTNYPYNTGDNIAENDLINAVLSGKEAVASTSIISAEFLQKESQSLADRAYFVFTDTPMARLRQESEEKTGMVQAVAAPVFNGQNDLIGVLYGAVLINRNYEIVDRIKHTVFQGVIYKGEDIGTATIFQDDVRISTNVMNEKGGRAIGTRVAEDVYDQVIVNGLQWIGRAYVVNNWRITAYEPIKNITGDVIGMLYVGILEQKYTDLRQNAILSFLGISFAGILASIIISFIISRNILIPVHKLVSASKDLARGNLEINVEKTSNDELGELAESFNSMASTLRERDERLKDFTRRKFMESERLALVGQLAANVAHELNNPLQGIVTYSHLLLEKDTFDEPSRQTIQKIVTQANRSRDIIRGLLDFSRQRKPDKTLCNINSLVQEGISLVENQALFHNIEIILNLDKDLPLVVVDPSQVVRVFINLIVNAAEAMDGTGRLTIISMVETNTNCIEVVVTDTGPGIPAENLEKIFDPFFTTKETGHGVGLGLAISYGIIKEHKGTISVESEVGEGTTFTVRLPIITAKSDISDE
jgi:two-component system, NtrC family, sensor kinase